MASVKIGTLIIRTLAKPLATMVKERARQHPRFREMCINLAQNMYRTEIRLRTNILGEAVRPAHVRPLSETRAIDQGANFIAEGFMFSVAAVLILGETYRSSRSQSKRRDSVDDQLEDLTEGLTELRTRIDTLVEKWEVQLNEEKQRNDELARILERVVEIGLRGGWAEFEGTPLQLPRIQLAPRLVSSALANQPSAFQDPE
ncbi:OPA3-domain-containing protein, partial [Coprinellus micaceus]